MARKSESGIDWELEKELARRGYTYEDTELAALHAFENEASGYEDNVYYNGNNGNYEATPNGDHEYEGYDMNSFGFQDRTRTFPREGAASRRTQQDIPQDFHRRLHSIDISGALQRDARGARGDASDHPQSNASRANTSSRAPVSPKSPPYFTWEDTEEDKQRRARNAARSSRGRTGSDYGEKRAVIPPKPPSNVPKPKSSLPSKTEGPVRASAWKSPPVKSLTDYKCGGRAQKNVNEAREGFLRSVNPPKPTGNVSKPKSIEPPKTEVLAKASAWKSPAVQPQADYKCGDRAQSSNVVPPIVEKKKCLSKSIAVEENGKQAVVKLPPEPTNGEGVINIAIVLPSGKRIKRRFNISDSLSLLPVFVRTSEKLPDGFEIAVNCPRSILRCNSTRVKTFEQAGIITNQALFVELPDPGNVPKNSKSLSTMDSLSLPVACARQISKRSPTRPSQSAPKKKTPAKGVCRGQVNTLPKRRPSSSSGG